MREGFPHRSVLQSSKKEVKNRLVQGQMNIKDRVKEISQIVKLFPMLLLFLSGGEQSFSFNPVYTLPLTDKMLCILVQSKCILNCHV